MLDQGEIIKITGLSFVAGVLPMKVKKKVLVYFPRAKAIVTIKPFFGLMSIPYLLIEVYKNMCIPTLVWLRF